jgi:trehalose/maltose hydrolase-like predicted phosphorylase
MTKQRMTQRFRGNALLSLWVCGMILVPGTIVPAAMARVATGMAPISTAAARVSTATAHGSTATARVSTATAHGSTTTARAAADTFTLTATQANFAQYYPTYLANGYWSVASSLLGTAPTVAHMVGIMDYDADDVSRPAAIPSWNEIDYFDGGAWLNGSAVGAQTHTGYGQTLDMHDGVLRTHYRWIDGERATDVSVTSFVSENSTHLGVVSLELTPHFSGRVRLRFTLQSPPLAKRLPLARMSAAEFSAAAVAAHQEDLASGGHRDAIWYPGHVEVSDSGGDTDTDTLFMTGTAVRGRTVALAAAIALPADLQRVHRTVQTASDATALEIEVRVQRNHRYRFTKFVAASSAGWGGGAAEDLAAARNARQRGLSSVLGEHVTAWHELWRSDILVGGGGELQRTIHSDLFYLLENSTADTAWPVGACGFSSHYFGHVFWDNDFWVFPSLLLLHPARAKSLIQFRQRSLPQALSRSTAHGFAGAMYPWEADPWSGEDVTPAFAVQNADREIHVNGAVALAQWQYYLATHDRAWLKDRAFPVIRSVADFWSSRAALNSAKARYEILGVTSPEEDYTDVNNEIYTNQVAHQSLEAAIEAARVLGVAPDPKWREIADTLYLPSAGDSGAFFDFDPTTPHDKSTSWMATSVPMLSIPALDFEAGADTLKGLFRHSTTAIGPVRGRANQMVLLMLAIQAANVGESGYFSDFIGGSERDNDPFLKPPFNVRSETPQNDSTYLLASSGGFVQAFVYGLTGLRIEEAGLVEKFAPTLPKSLSYLRLVNLEFRGKALDVVISRLPSGRVVRRVTFKAAEH